MLKDKNTLIKEFREGQKAYVSIENVFKPEKTKILQVIIRKIDENFIETKDGWYFEYREGYFELLLLFCKSSMEDYNEYYDYCRLFPTEKECKDSLEFDDIVYKITGLTSTQYYEHYSLEQLREVAKILNL